MTLDDPTSHSHKVRVAGDLMVVNHERNPTPIGRRAEQMPGVRYELRAALGREPTRAELAQKLSVSEADIVEIEAAEKQPYRNGGFSIYDVADPSKPKLIHHQLTGGIGVHRFDMDERYAYISTEMDGFVGNILVTYDLRDPNRRRKSRGGGCRGRISPVARKPTWPGKRHRLHHALRFGNEMFASCWHGGFRIVDVRGARQAENRCRLQLSPAVSGADAHGDAGAGQNRRQAHRADHRRRGPGAERQRGGSPPRPAACRHRIFDISDYAKSSRWRCSR